MTSASPMQNLLLNIPTGPFYRSVKRWGLTTPATSTICLKRTPDYRPKHSGSCPAEASTKFIGTCTIQYWYTGTWPILPDRRQALFPAFFLMLCHKLVSRQPDPHFQPHFLIGRCQAFPDFPRVHIGKIKITGLFRTLH